MGCGKTTLGKKLASKTGFTFIDLDKVIEHTAGKTIPQYFTEHGEAAFRELERDVLQNTEFSENSIIATGGGAPCYFNNMDWMNKEGLTVYISLPPAALASRLEKAEEVRPVLKDYKGEALIQFIAGKLNEREPFYSKAQITASGLGLTADKLWTILSA
jgi:shikimate kinase